MKPEEAVHALYVQRNRKHSLAEIFTHLKALEPSRAFAAVFVREAMRSARHGEVEKLWPEALKMLSRAGRQYSIGDKAFMATLAALQEPTWLGAIQAATVSDSAPLVVAAALARDGSDASADALVAEYERARASQDEWALRYKLKRLGRYAKQNATWKALEESVKQELARRDGKKAEASLAKQLGLHVPLLDFYVQVNGRKENQLRAVMLIISGNDRHGNLPTQALGLESKPPRDFTKVRAWLAKVTKLERVMWEWEDAIVRSNLRGKYRDAMLAWLRSERRGPTPDAK
jgi:hypothetical protein